MIFPHQICTYVADQSIPWEYVWLEFDGLKVKEIVETCGLSVDSPVYKPRYRDLARLMVEEMLYITQHSQESPLPSDWTSFPVPGLFHQSQHSHFQSPGRANA